MENEQELKARFALAYYKKSSKNAGTAFEAGQEVFTADIANVMRAASQWPRDPFVIAEMERLREDQGEFGHLPTKAQLCERVLLLADNELVDPKERLNAMKYYGELRGFNPPKNGVAITNNTAIQADRVMIVESHGTDDEWSRGVREQQKKLMQDAARH